ncbi:MAG: 2-amino-4-hydroxy-6-hydroxymethyldihydropteridine diphosphokinase [Bacteroidota bacterium]|nr:2-amino-4-hydroxy-6-hydroxymethyldihydropteridine diphosphokinase [Bacteroidota bacterium]MDP4215892.1 2-amino-4-hydroxy-6-hydroxymethyldihydropteridine diphosphokinase [Bacteroidota bacterium]MDP4246802.1 2-amino-4-hydroxy-6-hydroxymethyldihydropteridine diphosphokinase [Bacteroidota bacterium]MDP4254781.1 2-amino-4-hydroxy-6-hydroxymethyldihydropteridine diphosphokinase [Bacteroidota bacterium]
MNKGYLLIGGNVGDRQASLEGARTNIGLGAGKIVHASSIWQTAAWGKTDQAPFLNQALSIITPLDAPALMAVLLEIEEKMGRIRNERYGPRIIDIDILFYEDLVIDLPQLKVPHPEIQRRRFALAPLAEIAPDLIHPVLKRSIRDLLAECTDPGDVKKIPLII